MESRVVIQTELPGVEIFARGKVRDTYDLGDVLLMVSTDRISAFDVVLPNGIVDKGLVLNQLSGFWFKRTRCIIPNHLVRIVDNLEVIRSYLDSRVSDSVLASLVGRSMIVKKAQRIPIECIARGYLSGSAWAEYQQSGTVAGWPLPKGLKEGDELPFFLFTPTTKADKGHDEPITIKQMEEMVGRKRAEEMKRVTLNTYAFAKAFALRRRIIIADTKMEFGTIDGKLSLIDELLTPDSSRFWDIEKHKPGGSQPSYDKQPVRDWLTASGWNKQPPAPKLPPEVSEATTRRYREACQILTRQ